MVGPIAGAKVAVNAKSDNPVDCFDGGSVVSVIMKESGISTPPLKPCSARYTIIVGRSVAVAHSAEKPRNRAALTSR